MRDDVVPDRLQELTRAPFRVVDEINQGMDPVNERKIFKRMTDAGRHPRAPQTFLGGGAPRSSSTTCKYTRACTVLCIFNGPWIAEVAKQWRALQEALQPVPPSGHAAVKAQTRRLSGDAPRRGYSARHVDKPR